MASEVAGADAYRPLREPEGNRIAGVRPFAATAVQLALSSCFDDAGCFVAERVRRNLEHTEEVLRDAARRTDSRLYVLPEFSFQGWSPGRTVDDWCAASVRIPGPETERIGRLAAEVDAYVAGTLFEVLPEFPGRHFLTGFVVAPDGKVVLAYRKAYAFSAKTRPGDVHRAWVARFGRESLFPVVDTPIGRIGMVVAWDAIWPETMRALAMRGAEVILHPLGSPRVAPDADTAFEFLRRVRAYENVAYVVSANFGPLEPQTTGGDERWPSEIIDYHGRCLASTAARGEGIATATIDIAALRTHRAQPLRNWLAQLQAQLHADEYAAARLWPLSRWEDAPLRDAREFFAAEAAVWTEMCRSGEFRGPSEP